MQGLDAHFDQLLDMHQARIDQDAEIERRELEHCQVFNKVLRLRDAEASVPGTEIMVWKHGVRAGVREMTLTELFVDAMENKQVEAAIIRALILCYLKGDVDAALAIEPVRAAYAREQLSREATP